MNKHRKNERDWEKLRVILATQYNASGKAKRKTIPKDLILLDIDLKTKKLVRDEALIEQAMKAWQPIKA